MSVTSSRRSLKGLRPGRTADAELRAAVQADDSAAFQETYCRILAKPLKRIRKALRKTNLPIVGDVPNMAAGLSGSAASELLNGGPIGSQRKSGRSKKDALRAVDQFLQQWCSEKESRLNASQLPVVCELFLRHATQLNADVFVAVLLTLSGLMHTRRPLGGLFEGTESDTEQHDLTSHAIQHAEMPIVTSLILSPLGSSDDSLNSSVAQLVQLIASQTDKEGAPMGSMIRVLPGFMAVVARTAFWLNGFRQLHERTELCLHLHRSLLKCMSLATPETDGSTDSNNEAPFGAPFQRSLSLLLEQLDIKKASAFRRFFKSLEKPVRSLAKPPKYKRIRKEKEEDTESAESSSAETHVTQIDPTEPIFSASWQSDASMCAVMRSALDAKADVVFVNWHSEVVQIRAVVAGVPFIDGTWTWSARLNDAPVPSPKEWKCSCWFDDPECLFLEIEGENVDGCKCVRQVMLATHERFLTLNDTVSTAVSDQKVQFTSTLPLCPGFTPSGHGITRELSLSCEAGPIRAFPMWMDDDRIVNCPGHFREHDGQLELSGIGAGGVAVPVAIDWNPRRAELPADWTRLTVTENRRILSGAEASGHRVRIGDFQVLVYRSLKPGASSRAVLGLHTWDESVYTRIVSKADPMQPLVEVESPE